MKKMNRLSATLFSTLVAIVLFAVPASAHVEVKPDASTTGEEETYTIQVPVEKDVPTTKITIKMPAGVEFQQYEPMNGWTVSTEKNSDGKVSTITWTAAGEGILPDQFQQFTFVAKNPDAAQKISWNAYQYYKDGSIEEWTGEEGSDKPHAITTIQAEAKDTTKPSNEGNTAMQTITTAASLVALLVSIVALITSLRRKR